jgi:hypothetical protein
MLKDHHPGYITWQEYESNQHLLLENAYMKKNCARKSGRGGRALLSGMMRCGRCGRMMRVFYGMGKGNAHRYQCRGDDGHVGAGLCIGIGGVRIDGAVALQCLEAVSDHAVEAAIVAAGQKAFASDEMVSAVERDLEAAHYEASLAARRYELVDGCAAWQLIREGDNVQNRRTLLTGLRSPRLSAASHQKPIVDAS